MPPVSVYNHCRNHSALAVLACIDKVILRIALAVCAESRFFVIIFACLYQLFDKTQTVVNTCLTEHIVTIVGAYIRCRRIKYDFSVVIDTDFAVGVKRGKILATAKIDTTRDILRALVIGNKRFEQPFQMLRGISTRPTDRRKVLICGDLIAQLKELFISLRQTVIVVSNIAVGACSFNFVCDALFAYHFSCGIEIPLVLVKQLGIIDKTVASRITRHGIVFAVNLQAVFLLSGHLAFDGRAFFVRIIAHDITCDIGKQFFCIVAVIRNGFEEKHFVDFISADFRNRQVALPILRYDLYTFFAFFEFAILVEFLVFGFGLLKPLGAEAPLSHVHIQLGFCFVDFLPVIGIDNRSACSK